MMNASVATRSFLATVTNFRTSTQGRTRVLTATVRFENRTDKRACQGSATHYDAVTLRTAT